MKPIQTVCQKFDNCNGANDTVVSGSYEVKDGVLKVVLGGPFAGGEVTVNIPEGYTEEEIEAIAKQVLRNAYLKK